MAHEHSLQRSIKQNIPLGFTGLKHLTLRIFSTLDASNFA